MSVMFTRKISKATLRSDGQKGVEGASQPTELKVCRRILFLVKQRDSSVFFLCLCDKSHRQVPIKE